MKRIPLILTWILAAAALSSAQTTFYFPQIADGQQSGGGWQTVIAITNAAAAGTQAASGTVSFTQDNGTAFNIAFVDDHNQPVGSGNTIPFQVAGGQTRFYSSTAAGSLAVGFATVTSDLPVTGGAVFQEFSSSGSDIAQAGVGAATPLARQASFVIRESHADTAFAIANPSTSAATITFQLLDKNGVAAFPSASMTLPGLNHTAKFIGELFPNAPATFFGTMQVISQTPLVSTTLFFPGGGIFTTMPVIALAP